MIAFEKVTKCYASGQEALSEVSFLIKTGEMAFVTGHSGAGKSTLLNLMMLIERPTKGHILINDVAIDGFSHRQIPLLRRKFGIVHQNHQLLSDRSVFDNVALPLIIAGFAPRDVGRRVRAALDKVNLLSKEKQLPEMLSGGEQQRVGIARAVVNKPAFLIADEPTGNLDPELSTQIMQIFQDFNDVGVTVLVATHDLALLARMPHRSLTLREGKLIGSGLPSSSMHHSTIQPHDADQPFVQVDI
ncbi:MAG: cell division ATP-binding protein FtsE [Pseudomonadales bacterium]|nr:cell division ATP-binding protein FtsE [Pseudomonadales bacterium]